MRRKNDETHDKLLACARELIEEKGPGAVSIRAIAHRAGVATGTVYNYFGGKDEILLALTQEFWQGALAQLPERVGEGPFPHRVEKLYYYLCAKLEEGGGELMGSLAGVPRAAGRMDTLQGMLAAFLEQELRKDGKIHPEVWCGVFTPQAYAAFVANTLLASMRRREKSIDFLKELLSRTLYA